MTTEGPALAYVDVVTALEGAAAVPGWLRLAAALEGRPGWAFGLEADGTMAWTHDGGRIWAIAEADQLVLFTIVGRGTWQEFATERAFLRAVDVELARPPVAPVVSLGGWAQSHGRHRPVQRRPSRGILTTPRALVPRK